MNKLRAHILALAVLPLSSCVQTKQFPFDQGLIGYSRSRSVRVIAPSRNSSGSGFFLDPSHVVTCFHVIGDVRYKENALEVAWARDISVITEGGESISGRLASIPTDNDCGPIENDFAIIKLEHPAKGVAGFALLASESYQPQVGEPVLFSGFPLDTPAMITHQGFISGLSTDGRVIVIQASINKGNSGGALLSRTGKILGLISAREGRISQELQQQRQFLEGVTIQVGGFDVPKATAHLIDTLDKYISPGIGYARHSGYLSNWIRNNPRCLEQ